jgi:hypothetical protein
MNFQVISRASTTIFVALLLVAVVCSSQVQNLNGQSSQQLNAASTANLTKSDFSPVISSLVAVRQGILNNESITAYDALNSASEEIFGLSQNAANGNDTLAEQLTRQLSPVQNTIDNIRDGLRDDNATQALRSLNSGDLRLFSVIQELPAGENIEEEETTD